MSKDTVTVVGAGWVGLITAAIFASAGYTVYVVDLDKQKINTILKAESPFYEEGLSELIKDGIKSGRLIPTTDHKKSVSNSNVIFSCVGTPQLADGSYDMSQVMSSVETTLKYMNNNAIFVQKSTVPVGTSEIIEGLFSFSPKTLTYISNPEFLKESSAISDTLWFDRIVVGGTDDKAVETVMSIYKEVEAKRDKIAKLANLTKPKTVKSGEYIRTSALSAELIKVSANSFLALKLSFSNSIAQLAEVSGANIIEVLDAVGADRRIGREFLHSGRGYGGGCFPKDVSALLDMAKTYGVDLGIIEQTAKVNDSMPLIYINKAKELLGGSLKGKKVSVLGFAFKANTNDTRESPGVKIANLLSKQWANVYVYDPVAKASNSKLLPAVKESKSIEDAINNSDVIFVADEWDEFKKFKLTQYAKHMSDSNKIFVDCQNIFEVEPVEKAGLRYVGIGRADKKHNKAKKSQSKQRIE